MEAEIPFGFPLKQPTKIFQKKRIKGVIKIVQVINQIMKKQKKVNPRVLFELRRKK